MWVTFFFPFIFLFYDKWREPHYNDLLSASDFRAQFIQLYLKESSTGIYIGQSNILVTLKDWIAIQRLITL